jgi:1-acyl-sn-glycerol-3-phosphate acyltransferase
VAIGSSIEGTRFGNPADRGDLVTLGPFKSGLVRFAVKAQVPILPIIVLGAERVSPYLEEIWRREGIPGAYREIRRLRAQPQPITVCVLPPYRAHIGEEESRAGRQLRERAEWHTHRLGEIFREQIHALRSD